MRKDKRDRERWKLIPRVPPKYLLLIAALVWMIAGGHFLYFYDLYLLQTGAEAQCKNFDDGRRTCAVYRFFDKKSYLMMIFMISGGMLLRGAHLLPGIAIGIMYSGIGVSLLGAGVLFLQKFAAAMIPADPQS